MSEFVVTNMAPADQSSTFRWILAHLSRHTLLLLVMLVGAFGNAALAALMPILIGMAFNAVAADPSTCRWWVGQQWALW
ncbi:MAG: hypothetical protein M5U34_03630 [Chloroflexi bacterium]|nr:hypothetical protein [Chloroflexota bacterium]